MTFSINQVQLRGIMELTGTIEFPDGKMVVIYGSNQQGKTNVINAVRYAFLKDVFARVGRTKIEYDERKLPSREELVFDDTAEIEISFAHDGVEYSLVRSIQSKGKRDSSTLSRTDSPDDKIDIEPFLRNKLKVSLLDALFAPEIAQGFEQLYSGDIEEAVSKMFKDVSTLRTLATAFVARLDRLGDATDAERVRIESSYNDFCNSLAITAPTTAKLPGWEDLRKFEPGRIFAKLDSFHVQVQRLAGKLEEEGLEGGIEDKMAKSVQLTKVQRALERRDDIIQKIAQMKDTNHDCTILTSWVRAASSVKNLGSRLKPTPVLRDRKVLAGVEAVAGDFTAAKEKKRRAEELAKKEEISVEGLSDVRKTNSKVIELLSEETRIGNEVAASVTKSEGKVYAVLPLKLLEKDPSYADISRQPIPKGDRKERKRYLESLKAKQKRLKTIGDLQEESESLYEEFVEKGLKKVNNLVDKLNERKEGLKDSIDGWVGELATESSSFTGESVRKQPIQSSKAAVKYAKTIESAVSAAASRHLVEVNRTLKDLGISVTAFNPAELSRALAQVKEQRGERPQIEQAEVDLSGKKEEWRGVGEEYGDYTQVPRIVDESKAVLELMLSKCFDEAVLRKEIANTYNEIIHTLQERRLVQATAEIGPDELKSVVTYKGKKISHPAGSEKSFFSLAILTALAHYFRVPVLIDEVANNLDTKNLKAFFELVREFKDRYGVQFVLSIKQTNDFELDGWVRDLRDEIALYQVKDKIIERVQL